MFFTLRTKFLSFLYFFQLVFEEKKNKNIERLRSPLIKTGFMSFVLPFPTRCLGWDLGLNCVSSRRLSYLLFLQFDGCMHIGDLFQKPFLCTIDVIYVIKDISRMKWLPTDITVKKFFIEILKTSILHAYLRNMTISQ